MQLPVNYNELTFVERRVVREEYIKQQQGLCHHCGASLDGDPANRIQSMPVRTVLFPQGFFDHPVHLHHNHNTGMTIGAVHCHCNAVLWQYYGE